MATIDSTLPNAYSTDLNKESGKSSVVFDDLSFHVESLSDNELLGGVIVFEPLTEAQRDTVMTFYTTNKNLPFDYANPVSGDTDTFYFTGAPPYPKAIAGWKPLAYTINYTVIGDG